MMRAPRDPARDLQEVCRCQRRPAIRGSMGRAKSMPGSGIGTHASVVIALSPNAYINHCPPLDKADLLWLA